MGLLTGLWQELAGFTENMGNKGCNSVFILQKGPALVVSCLTMNRRKLLG